MCPQVAASLEYGTCDVGSQKHISLKKCPLIKFKIISADLTKPIDANLFSFSERSINFRLLQVAHCGTQSLMSYFTTKLPHHCCDNTVVCNHHVYTSYLSACMSRTVSRNQHHIALKATYVTCTLLS